MGVLRTGLRIEKVAARTRSTMVEVLAQALGFSCFRLMIGLTALFWDVPTFGNQAERVTQECLGSGQVAREYWLAHPSALETLRYANAASAAKRVTVPVFATPALADAVVPPPGQFAVVNSLAGPVLRHALRPGTGSGRILIQLSVRMIQVLGSRPCRSQLGQHLSRSMSS